MPKSRSHVTARHLVIHRLDSTVPFPAIARCLESHLEARPELGLFLDPAEGLVRVGGLDLHGDILIRPESTGRDHRLLVACRHGDRGSLESLMNAMATLWTRSDRAPAAREGLGLLNFLQSDPLPACLDRVEFADRAIEDAFACRFVGLGELRRALIRLHGKMGDITALLEILSIEIDDRRRLWSEPPKAPSVILHNGKRRMLCLKEEIMGAKGSRLTLHLDVCARRKRCIVGALSE